MPQATRLGLIKIREVSGKWYADSQRQAER
jgi:hypothetical protein